MHNVCGIGTSAEERGKVRHVEVAHCGLEQPWESAAQVGSVWLEGFMLWYITHCSTLGFNAMAPQRLGSEDGQQSLLTMAILCLVCLMIEGLSTHHTHHTTLSLLKT